ncbi:MAG TPA: hypothetical protein DCW90_05545 [Lachnospiraceae bacterium]|nr:hypothetical protein [uncultured Lachnoclostridium sp.]HAU84969.1 hypothetical protein [Lachnospiraceae bacterium]
MERIKQILIILYGGVTGIVGTPIVLVCWVMITGNDGFEGFYSYQENQLLRPFGIIGLFMFTGILAVTIWCDRKNKQGLIGYISDMLLGIGVYVVYQLGRL